MPTVPVIVTDAQGHPTASLTDCKLDLSYGRGDNAGNDFELTIYDPHVRLQPGARMWVQGTEYGGIVDHVTDTVTQGVPVLTYRGRTWQGVLVGKILQPDYGQDYLTVSGQTGSVLGQLFARVGLGQLYHADADNTNIKSYAFDRYTTAWDGICKMLDQSQRRLRFIADSDTIRVRAEPVKDWNSAQDSGMIDFSVGEDWRRTNHMIGLGQGQLKARQVVHWYADAAGNLSQHQSLFGADEITAVYDASSDEPGALSDDTRNHLQELQGQGTATVTVHDGLQLGVGDIVHGQDPQTGVTVTANIVRVTVALDGGIMRVSYDVGTPSATASGSTGSTSVAGSGTVYVAGKGISIDGSTISAQVSQADLEAVRKIAQDAQKSGMLIDL